MNGEGAPGFPRSKPTRQPGMGTEAQPAWPGPCFELYPSFGEAGKCPQTSFKDPHCDTTVKPMQHEGHSQGPPGLPHPPCIPPTLTRSYLPCAAGAQHDPGLSLPGVCDQGCAGVAAPSLGGTGRAGGWGPPSRSVLHGPAGEGGSRCPGRASGQAGWPAGKVLEETSRQETSPGSRRHLQALLHRQLRGNPASLLRPSGAGSRPPRAPALLTGSAFGAWEGRARPEPDEPGAVCPQPCGRCWHIPGRCCSPAGRLSGHHQRYLARPQDGQPPGPPSLSVAPCTGSQPPPRPWPEPLSRAQKGAGRHAA